VDGVFAAYLAVVALAHALPPATHNENYRIRHVLHAATQLARGTPLAEVLDRHNRGDDAGSTLLLSLLIQRTFPAEELRTSVPEKAPRSYYLILLAGNAAAFTILYPAVRSLMNRGVAFALGTIYLWSPASRFVWFAGDVYFFPIYAAILMLAAAALIRHDGRLPTVLFGLCLVGIAGCNFFRQGSALVACLLLLILIWPECFAGRRPTRRLRLKAGLGLLVVALLTTVPARLIGRTNHLLWHPLHCGLAEFGGHTDAAGRLYPYFVPARDLPPDTVPVHAWSDDLQFALARQVNPAIEAASREYEAVIRDDFLRLVREYPLGVAGLMARRAWRVVNLNPRVGHGPDSAVKEDATGPFWRLGWILLVLLGGWLGYLRRELLLVLGLTPLLLPVLLVHSGYTMYNLSAQFPLYLLSLAALHKLTGLKRRGEAVLAESGLDAGESIRR